MDGAARVGEADDELGEAATTTPDRGDEDGAATVDVHRLRRPLGRLLPAGRLERLLDARGPRR